MKKIIISFFLLASVLAFSQAKEVSETPINSAKDKYSNTADTSPEFPGGINAFRKSISQSFNMETLMKTSMPTKSETKFLIDINGNITTVVTIGDSEALNREMTRVIKSIKSKWKPATYQGQPVQYWFSLPMTFG